MNADMSPQNYRKIRLRLASSLSDLGNLRPVSLEFHRAPRSRHVRFSNRAIFLSRKSQLGRVLMSVSEINSNSLLSAKVDCWVLRVSFFKCQEFI